MLREIDGNRLFNEQLIFRPCCANNIEPSGQGPPSHLDLLCASWAMDLPAENCDPDVVNPPVGDVQKISQSVSRFFTSCPFSFLPVNAENLSVKQLVAFYDHVRQKVEAWVVRSWPRQLTKLREKPPLAHLVLPMGGDSVLVPRPLPWLFIFWMVGLGTDLIRSKITEQNFPKHLDSCVIVGVGTQTFTVPTQSKSQQKSVSQNDSPRTWGFERHVKMCTCESRGGQESDKPFWFPDAFSSWNVNQIKGRLGSPTKLVNGHQWTSTDYLQFTSIY